MIVLSPMSPADEAVPYTFDFSNLVAPGDSIASAVPVTSVPAGLTIGEATVVAGSRAGCAVQCTLGSGTAGVSYLVTAEIVTAAGVTLARSAYVPVAVV